MSGGRKEFKKNGRSWKDDIPSVPGKSFNQRNKRLPHWKGTERREHSSTALRTPNDRFGVNPSDYDTNCNWMRG